MTTCELDQAKVDAFAQRMVAGMNHAALALMTSLGHRTGLFDAMAGMDAAGSHAIAERAGLNERYVREWLGAMATGGIVEHDAQTQTYRLPPEHAACLTRAASPNNMAATMQWFAVLGGVETEIAAAFRHGQGVPYAAYDRFHEVMAEESAQTVVAGLRQHILPLEPGLAARLEQGLEVVDVGCGSGQALLALAEWFPASRFTGYDFSEEAMARANADAQRRGLRNVHFMRQDAAELPDRARFDLVLAFDAIHDQARPDTVLAAIRTALRPGGIFFMQDIDTSSEPVDNIDHPLGAMLYTVSCMHCMTVSLAQGGMGLGAAWGVQLAQKMLREAGFHRIRIHRFDHDVQNCYYIMET